MRRNDGASAIGCISRNGTVGNPNVDQRLHRLRIPVCEKAVQFGDRAEVDKARIEVSPTLSIILPAKMPERVDPMRMIEMCVDTKNLTKTCAAVMEECFREACALANPVTTVGFHARGSSRSLGRECFGVVDFAIHPPLNQTDILRCRYGDRIFLVIQPGIRVAVEGQNQCHLLMGHQIIPPSSSHFWAKVRIANRLSSVVIRLLNALSNSRDDTIVLNGFIVLY